MQQEILNLQTEMETETAINEGTLQEYDYNNEYEECEWRQN